MSLRQMMLRNTKGASSATIKAFVQGKKFLKTTSEIPDGEQFGVLPDKTNFYTEADGQEFDVGRLVIDDFAELDVNNVQSCKGRVLHTGFLKYGSL